MPNPPRAPAECFAAILQWLGRAVAAQTGWGLALPLIALIVDRLRRIKQRFADLADRLRDGRYVPRHRAARPRPRPGQPPPPLDPLPQTFGWLLPLVPDAVGFRSQLEYLLRDPEMAALLAAAPAPMARTLRPLCRMLGVTPPPVLAAPAKAHPPPARSQAAPAADSRPPPSRRSLPKSPLPRSPKPRAGPPLPA